MGSTISISFWQTEEEKYVDPEHFLECGSECRPNAKNFSRDSNYHLNKGSFVDTWQLPKENNYFLTNPLNVNFDNELHLIDLKAICLADFQLTPKNQWLWHGIRNSNFSKKCRDCRRPGHMSRLRWFSTRTSSKMQGMSTWSLMGKSGT